MSNVITKTLSGLNREWVDLEKKSSIFRERV